MVDCFSKWTELLPVKDKASETIANVVYSEVISQYRKPYWFRCDRGREFMGAFQALCESIGVAVRRTSAGHP